MGRFFLSWTANFGYPYRMPELAEVETVRKILDKNLRRKKIVEVDVDMSDKYLFAFAKPGEVKRALTGATVVGSGRRGKYMWLTFRRKGKSASRARTMSLIVHLGMSGNISLKTWKGRGSQHANAWGGVALQSENKTARERPDHLWFCRLLIKMADGTEVALLDPRRFGRVWLSDDPAHHPRIARLGPDPLIDFPTASALEKTLRRRKMAIKPVLLDQSVFAGIGNWLADEILFQAKMSPHRKASELTMKDVSTLRKYILSVVKKAVAVDADYKRFPKSWIFHHRWGKAKGAKTSLGLKIIHEQIGGRTAAWVPAVQKS